MDTSNVRTLSAWAYYKKAGETEKSNTIATEITAVATVESIVLTEAFGESAIPASGNVRIYSGGVGKGAYEVFSYSAYDDGTKTLTITARAQEGTQAMAHAASALLVVDGFSGFGYIDKLEVAPKKEIKETKSMGKTIRKTVKEITVDIKFTAQETTVKNFIVAMGLDSSLLESEVGYDYVEIPSRSENVDYELRFLLLDGNDNACGVWRVPKANGADGTKIAANGEDDSTYDVSFSSVGEPRLIKELWKAAE